MKRSQPLKRLVEIGFLSLATFLLFPDAGRAGPSGNGKPLRTPEQIYLAACAHCHGTDGRGVPADRLSLPVPVPDFTDCRFAPREAEHDWHAVIRNGGPARGFHRTMPAFGEALSAEEIQQVLHHVHTFCTEHAWPRGELNFPKAVFTEKAFPEDELLVVSNMAVEGSGELTTKIIYEKRFRARNQVEFILPIAAHSLENRWDGGIGDLAMAFKRVLAHSRSKGSIVSMVGELGLPTGREELGFGNGYSVLETAVLFGQALPAESFVQFQGGFGFPFNGPAANEAFWRLAVGKTFSQGGWGRSWSPMVEFLAARELIQGEKIAWDIVPQMQVTLSTRQHIRMNVGLNLPLTDAGPRAARLVFYFLWDWFDGGIRQGW